MIKPCYGKCDYCGATQIDREALLHDIEQSVVYTARGKITSAEMRGAHKIIERIKCAPAVEPIYIHEPTVSQFRRMAAQMDYAPVVYGRWVTHYRSGTTVAEGYVSTCCDMWNNRKSDNCPNCGAKMNGGDNDATD